MSTSFYGVHVCVCVRRAETLVIHSLDTADNAEKIKNSKGVQTSQVFAETVTYNNKKTRKNICE